MFENYFKRLVFLDSGEEIKKIIHHHPLTFLGTIIKITILPVLIIIFSYFFGADFLESILSSYILSLIFLALLIIWATFGFYHWYIWYFDAIILTDSRVILIEQKRLFERKVTEASFQRIQDVTIGYSGVLQNILRYGYVSIQTAGESPNLSLKNIRKPQEINNFIMKLRDKFHDKEKQPEEE